MTPRLLLSLWRGRWAKADGAAAKIPYRKGKVHAWVERMAEAPAWSYRLFTVPVAGACLLVLGWTIAARHTVDPQLAFAVFLLVAAWLLSRYSGRLFTLAVLGLSCITSARYLNWRFSATLSPNFDWAFILGAGLALAELYLCLWVLVGWINTLWPLRRVTVPLPDDTGNWPTVDVLILAERQPLARISAALAAHQSLLWPARKIKIHVVDAELRHEVRAIASAAGCSYWAQGQELEAGWSARWTHVNHILSQIQGEVTLLVEADQVLEPPLLRTTLGWLMDDPKLAMLQTPTHLLGPAPQAHHLQLCGVIDAQPSCAIFRRSALLAAGGLLTEPLSANAHTALALQTTGHGHAYFGPAGRVDTPVIARLTPWRETLLSLQAMLQFYYPLPRLVFYTAPLAYLWAHLAIIQTSPELLAAYALPHMLHGYLAQSRLQGSSRYPLLTDLREAFLAWYLLLPTAWTLLRTELARLKYLLPHRSADRAPPFDWIISLPFALVVALNVWGLVVGGTRLLVEAPAQAKLTGLYLAWTACLLLLSAATWAVAEEARHIRRHSRALRHMPAMLRLANGRTVSCRTENFPDPTLTLNLPSALALPLDTTVHISVFRDQREFVFPSRIISSQDRVLQVSIDQSSMAEYAALAAAARSRGQDWPKWLPSRDADQLLPAWFKRMAAKALTVTLDLLIRLAGLLGGERFVSWIQQWKPKKS